MDSKAPHPKARLRACAILEFCVSGLSQYSCFHLISGQKNLRIAKLEKRKPGLFFPSYATKGRVFVVRRPQICGRREFSEMTDILSEEGVANQAFEALLQTGDFDLLGDEPLQIDGVPTWCMMSPGEIYYAVSP